MYKRHKCDIIVIAAVVGLMVSMYLAITKTLDITVPCGVTKGCETVLTSQYSEILGIPLPWLGIAFFGGAVGLGLLANHYNKTRKFLTWYLGAGALSSLVFLGLQLFVIGQFCQYCLVTDSLALFMFLWDLNVGYAPPSATPASTV